LDGQVVISMVKLSPAAFCRADSALDQVKEHQLMVEGLEP
jgi:hypothetical protein